MSYDITYISKRPDQSWEEAAEAHEERAASESQPSSQSVETKARWRRIVERVREAVPSLEPSDPDSCEELTDPNTGVQLSVYGGEIGLSVPYWHEGDAAETVASQLVAIARIVEAETGLRGFDGQQEGPFLSGPAAEADAAQELARVTWLIRGEELGGVAPRHRPWWRFW